MTPMEHNVNNSIVHGDDDGGGGKKVKQTCIRHSDGLRLQIAVLECMPLVMC